MRDVILHSLVFLFRCMALCATTDCERAFDTIYKQGVWGRDTEGKGTSGGGSTLKHGTFFIDYVQKFINTHEVHSIVDVGCGDWALAEHIDWGDRDYLGIDVVQDLIERNRERHSTEKIHFMHLDAGRQELPSGDLLICKDVLCHLPLIYIHHILAQINQFKYCILVCDFAQMKRNKDCNVGDWRPLDLTKSPFYLQPKKMRDYQSDGVLKHIYLIDEQ